MSTFYAWSDIRTGAPTAKADEPGEVKTIKRGDTVSQADAMVDDDGWRQLVESGAIRTLQVPDMPDTYQGSPIDFLKEQAAKAGDDAMNAVMASPEVIAAVNAQVGANAGLLAENVDPEVQEEWERQLEAEGGSGQFEEPTPQSGEGTGGNVEPPPAGGSS